MVDTTQDRMKFVAFDREDPFSFHKKDRAMARTPRSMYFLPSQEQQQPQPGKKAKAKAKAKGKGKGKAGKAVPEAPKPKTIDQMVVVWLVIQAYLLRRLAVMSARAMRGLDRETWRRTCKLIISNLLCDGALHELGIDVDADATPLQPMLGVREPTITRSDVGHNNDTLADILNMGEIPLAVVNQLRAMTQRQDVGEVQASDKPENGALKTAIPTLGNDDSDDEDDAAEDINGVFCYGTANYFQPIPDVDELPPRAESERYKVEPADWFTKPKTSVGHWYECEDNVMKPIGTNNREFGDVRRIMDCWFDYENNRKLYFCHYLRDDGEAGGERLLNHPSKENPAADGKIYWLDFNGKAMDPAKASRRVWPARSEPAKGPAGAEHHSSSRPRNGDEERPSMQKSQALGAMENQGLPWVNPNHDLKFALVVSQLAVSSWSFDGHPLPRLRDLPHAQPLFLPENIRAYVLWETTPELLDALVALFTFMSVWPRAHYFLRLPSRGWTMDDVESLGMMVWRCYTQTYFDYFRTTAPMPFLRPPVPW
ncbi:hypothetical protein AURDEDRAFT_173885 [Auricularia subglabra TFB-10046 SS5]|nr:hypothetical protein AURDEDRAFT_173885 [Auricularia subglabra TFB-10046 SS5]